MRTRYFLLLPVILAIAGCVDVEVLEPAHQMALENQGNLAKNVDTMCTALQHTVATHPEASAEDKALVEDLVSTTKEQIAISAAYLALISVFIEGRDIDSDTFEEVLKEIPRLVTEGKDIWEAITKMLEEK